jgi:hypothetical protein
MNIKWRSVKVGSKGGVKGITMDSSDLLLTSRGDRDVVLLNFLEY